MSKDDKKPEEKKPLQEGQKQKTEQDKKPKPVDPGSTREGFQKHQKPDGDKK